MNAFRSIAMLVGLLGIGWAAGPAPAQDPRYSPYAGGYYPAGYGYYGPYSNRVGGAVLQGQAAKIDATGQYYKDIQQASMTRVKVRQESLVTQKKRVLQEMEYEDLRKARYRQEMEHQRVNTNDRARRFPTDDEIWSGKSLNILMKSVMMSPSPPRGPNIAISPETLRGLNLLAAGSSGNLGLAKDGGKIDWTDALMQSPFGDARNRFGGNFELAMKDIQAGQQPDRVLIADLKREYKSLSDTLDDRIADISPGDYTRSRRQLKELKNTLDGLSDRR